MGEPSENVTSIEVRVEGFHWLREHENPFSWRPGDLLPYAEREDIVTHIISKSGHQVAKKNTLTFKK